MNTPNTPNTPNTQNTSDPNQMSDENLWEALNGNGAAVRVGDMVVPTVPQMKATKHNYRETDQSFEARRARFRQQQLETAILEPDTPTRFEMDFYGSGDSGDYETADLPQEVAELLQEACEKYVTWDWCNNDGGGGNITWDLPSDEMEITGHYNVMESVDVDPITVE